MPEPRRTGSRSLGARPRAGAVAGAALALGFALLVTAIGFADQVAPGGAIVAGQPAPRTVRVPLFLGRTVAAGSLSRGAVVVVRGEWVRDPALARLAAQARAAEAGGPLAVIAFAAGVFLAGLLFAASLRRSPRGRLRRSQLVSLAALTAVAALAKLVLVTTALSPLVLPVGSLGLLAALAVDGGAGLATAAVAALVVGLQGPFDPAAIGLVTLQGLAAVLALGDGRRPGRILAAGAASAAVGALAYPALYQLAWHELPLAELATPLRSAWLACVVGGLGSGAVAALAHPLYRRLLGEIGRARLGQLEDLGHPILVQIADKTPGTWQHSLAMANLGEAAARAIGANERLVRIGAYYHDLGKTVAPKLYVENLLPGETSPHETLPARASRDAIVAHVTEGVRLGRQAGLPEAVIDFMHMHHGDGLLAYFWARCQEQGNPDGLGEADFRYPGLPPRSRETAILAICDAVEGASRTLRQPDQAAIRALVERIVYGKLHLGQLDDSGLGPAELRQITSALVEALRHGHHGAIGAAATDHPEAEPAPLGLAAGELARGPRLDSLDLPRPAWRPKPARPLETAATQPLAGSSPPAAATGRTAMLRRPPTAAEVARATAEIVPLTTPKVDPGDVTAIRAIPIPPEALPDDRRVTTQRTVAVPAEARIDGDETRPADELPALAEAMYDLLAAADDDGPTRPAAPMPRDGRKR